MAKSIDSTDDLIDVRDIIARVEELEGERDATAPEDWAGSDGDLELVGLSAFMVDLRGYGGDEQWRGDWYPVTLIRDSYFEAHARELADDCGMIKDDAAWPYTCIDWQKAARELRMDYTATEFEGVTYWYR